MVNLKRILAGTMAGITTLSLAACSNSGSSETTGSATSTTAETTIDDEIENPVSVGDISIDAGEEVEPAELEYLGCYDITTAGDVKPSYKYFSENYGCTIKCTIVGSLQIQEKLTTAISSGESPDLVDYADNTFPLLMSKNMYTPLEEYMDLSAPQWNGLEQYINSYKWGGKNYYYPWAYNVAPYFLIYNRAVFEQIGIEDPKVLYDKGEWTWDAMKEDIRKFIDSDADGKRTGLYGAMQYSAQSFINSTGTPLITVDESGKLVHNFNNANVDRAASFMQEMKKEGLASFQEGVIDVDTAPMLEGTAAFQCMGEWIISGYARAMLKDDTLDYFFVPFPRDVEADEYYYPITTFGYLVPAGSKYAKQASVFINCCRLSNTDEDLKATTKESIMRSKKYTDEMYDFIYSFKEPTNFHCVVDNPYGLDETTGQIVKDILGNTLFDIESDYSGQSWTQMREANIGAIDKQIEYYNGLLN